jgi:hypothetical protein
MKGARIPNRRRSVHAVFVLALVAAAILALAGAMPLSASTPHLGGWQYGWSPVKAKCLKTNQDLVRAQVSTSMRVRNYGIGGHWITKFHLKARLVPPGFGFKSQRSWQTTRFPVRDILLRDAQYDHPIAVNTDAINPERPWVVQVKLIWKRRFPWRDMVVPVRFPFDTSDCRAADQADAKK